jgi:uroporphyrinogen decarboxylase
MGLPDEVLVGGYIIGPVTLAGLLEGAEQAAMDSVIDPDKLETLCRFCTRIIQDYARALINAGADLLCILEPTAVILGPAQFEQFSAAYVRQIIESYKYAGVDTIYHICGNTMHLIEAMARSGVAAVSLDSPQTGVDLVKAARLAGPEVVVMGNINPTAVMKDGSADQVRKACRDLLEQMREIPNFILSTGCDLPPGVPLENMHAFMQAAREFS